MTAGVDDHQPPAPPRWLDREEMELALRAQAARWDRLRTEAAQAHDKLVRLATQAQDERNPYRMGARAIGAATSKGSMTVHEWINGPTETRAGQPRQRCRARAAHTGHRCKALARPGAVTCWAHRQVPDHELLAADAELDPVGGNGQARTPEEDL